VTGRFALTIGVDYARSALQPLPAAPNDARELAEVLGDPGIGGFDVTPSVNEPAQLVKERIEGLFRNTEPQDLVLLAFSGHALRATDPYLALADTDPSLPLSTTIGRRFLSSVLDHAPVEHIVVVLDCCYSAGFRFFAPDGLLQPRQGICVMSSSLADQASWAGDFTSVFTSALIEGLRTGRADGFDDRAADGLITARELFAVAADACRRSRRRQEARLHLVNGADGDIVVARRVGSLTGGPLPVRLAPGKQAASSTRPPSARHLPEAYQSPQRHETPGVLLAPPPQPAPSWPPPPQPAPLPPAPQPPPASGPAVNVAPVSRRLGARAIDLGVWLGITLAVSATGSAYLVATGNEEPTAADPIFPVMNGAYLALIGCYEAVTVARFSGSVGKRILGLRVISTRSRPIRSGLLRAGALFAYAAVSSIDVALYQAHLWSAMVIALPLIMITGFSLLLDSRRRAAWDYLAGTIVVVDQPAPPLTPLVGNGS
jgi:uncharacterized RDD family membrane protein YckC